MEYVKQKTDRTSMLQYINTALLSVTLLVVGLAANNLVNLNNEVSSIKLEQLRIKTVQDNNVINVTNVTNRVTSLELNYVEALKTWVDMNYVRKAQK